MPTTSAAARAQVAARGLTPAAVSALIPLMRDVGFDELAVVKALLKRFFADGPWTSIDAADLARAIGPGDDEVVRTELDDDLTLVAGWVDGTFFVDVESASPGATPDEADAAPLDLSRTFDLGVVPEPTPNPRTIRFATGRRDVPASTSYRRGAGGSERTQAIFDADPDVVDVLVAADFVAVSLARPARWPEALEPILAAVAEGFAGDSSTSSTPPPDRDDDGVLDVRGVATTGGRDTAPDPTTRRRTRLDSAWSDLGHLDAANEDDRRLLLAATADRDSARRQVAAQLLDAALLEDARPAWDALLTDTSRAVRRAALDAVVGAEDESLRPLLERALGDTDAWMRWKALNGLVVLGVGPSLDAIGPLDDDPDFRVRLEAANARRPRP